MHHNHHRWVLFMHAFIYKYMYKWYVHIDAYGKAYTYIHMYKSICSSNTWINHYRHCHYWYIAGLNDILKIFCCLMGNMHCSDIVMSINGVSNHQRYDCLLNCLFRCRSKKTSKLRITGLCEENSQDNGVFPAQRASNTENVFIWWRHHVTTKFLLPFPDPDCSCHVWR